MAQLQIPLVLTIVTHQLQLIDKVVDVPAGRFSCSTGAVCDSEIFQLLHVDALVLVGPCAQAQGRSLFGNRDRYAQCKLCPDQPVEIRQVQFLDKFDVPVVSETGTFSAVCVQTVKIPQVPFLVMFLTCPVQ